MLSCKYEIKVDICIIYFVADFQWVKTKCYNANFLNFLLIMKFFSFWGCNRQVDLSWQTQIVRPRLTSLDFSDLCDVASTMLTTGVRKVFRSHGEFCSTQPWEVIVATLTFLVCILTVWGKHNDGENGDNLNSTSVGPNGASPPSTHPPWTTMELVVMTFIRCLALLHCYYHLKKVHRVGSSLIMKVILAYYGFTVLLYRWVFEHCIIVTSFF